MRCRFLAIAALLVACDRSPAPGIAPDPIAPYDPLPLVDPTIGTGGIGAGVGSLTPAAGLPFGMVLVGPDTRGPAGAPGFYHCSGYYYDDDQIDGFAHTHAHGMGVTDYGGVLVMPRAGWDDTYVAEAARSAPFDHASEVAIPGSYEVVLDDDGTHVQIAATTRGAVHRYTFEDTAEPVVLFDLGHALGDDYVDGAEIAVEGQVITGYQRLVGDYSGRFGGLRTWMHAEVEPAPVDVGTWTEADAPAPGTSSAAGLIAGAWLTFPPGTEQVELRVAISYVDADGAAGNFVAEVEGRSLEDVRAAAEDVWREELGSVRVRGGTEEQRRIFHTALYHAYIWPSTFQDVDGRYRGFDQQIHTADFDYHTDMSLWDTFRTLHPWLILAKPDRQRDIARSLVRMYEDGGSMPKWPLGHGYTGGMVGSPAAQVLAETWLKGIDDWDAETGFEACWLHSQGPMPHNTRGGIEDYLTLGYASYESTGGPASKTLEFAWNDHALALWADDLQRSAEADVLWAQSGNWRNTWDGETGFFLGRYRDGSFERGDDPLYWSDAFVEGGAWQYVWGVPQDVDGMVALQHDGDYDAFFAKLDGFWAESFVEEDDAIYDSWYWHGNEPDLHYAYLGSLAGDLDRSALHSRFVLAAKYDDTPRGLDGNDDGGTLSAWYLWAAMGVYPIAGTTDYALGSPIFDRVEIDLADGSTLVVDAPGASEVRMWPHRVRVGDRDVRYPVITHDELVGAGAVRFDLGTVPMGWMRSHSLGP